MILSVDDYVKGILNKDISVLARAITLIESNKPEHQKIAEQLLYQILPYTNKSFRLGITGAPGVGKSTFIEAFGLYCIEKGHQLAVLAIDPSSSISKGSILGDKTRMETLSRHPHAFIRPSPSGGVLGGIASKTYETMLLCEAAGFDWIFIETVGVGQSETDVAEISDFFLLLMLASSGDEIQGIKRGIMEMADGIVITKCDGDNITKANLAAAQFKSALHYFTHPLQDWNIPVLPTSSITKKGLDEIYNMLIRYRELALEKKYFFTKRTQQQQIRLKKIISDFLSHDFFSNEKILQKLNTLKEEDYFFPHRVAKKLIEEYRTLH
ncbi:MAG: methylmalonyl Co-A mutase-associated GTPase MeaB [Bacteroidia bacterium]|nr:methylmalonyl Co-A mutase-associated GTPase MeaB [Bacteroidia bacterium]